ncbi:MAG: IclR family transcriptional regulator [Alphaproteobacteria bacterium]|nr:MAG: IclR family transcriptional regulator [Alphaproteobacteria bacterium]
MAAWDNGAGEEMVAEQSRSVRGIELLFHVARSDGPVTANELAEMSALPKATVYRLCDQLRNAGFLRRHAGARGYVPGPKLLELSSSVLAARSQQVYSHAVLEGLAEEIGEACNYAVPDGTAMVYWDRVETRWPLRFQLPIGSRVPLHCTANGKLYLSSLPEEQRLRLIGELKLERHTANTITSPEALREALDEITEQGYGTDNEEFIDGMVALAMPVTDSSGRMLAGVAFHAPVQRMTLDDAKQYLPLLRQAVEKLSGQLRAGESEGTAGDGASDGVRQLAP